MGDALVNEPSSTGTTMLKKVGVAVLVGAAFVVGNSRGSSMNTPKTEIETFLSSVKPYVKPYDGIISCSGRWFSTAPLVSENIFPGETICGQVCLTRVQEVGLGLLPRPHLSRVIVLLVVIPLIVASLLTPFHSLDSRRHGYLRNHKQPNIDHSYRSIVRVF